MKIIFQKFFSPINIYMTEEEIEKQLDEYLTQVEKSNLHLKYHTSFSVDCDIFELLNEISDLTIEEPLE